MWDHPGQGIEPLSPALQGRSLTTGPSGHPTVSSEEFIPEEGLAKQHAASPWRFPQTLALIGIKAAGETRRRVGPLVTGLWESRRRSNLSHTAVALCPALALSGALGKISSFHPLSALQGSPLGFIARTDPAGNATVLFSQRINRLVQDCSISVTPTPHFRVCRRPARAVFDHPVAW